MLFIDEAYRLKDGQFAHEAINELVDALTKEKFANKLVTILAGYNEDINQLMSINPGLTSRFPEEITFRSLTPEECKELLEQNLTIKGIAILCPDEGTKAAEDRVLDLFSCLSSLPAWGNARDVQTIAKGVYGELLKANISSSALTTDVQLIVVQLEAMIKERSDRARSARPFIPSRSQKLPPASVQGPSMPTPINTAQSSQVNPAKPPPPPEEPETPSIEHKDEPTSSPSDRDPGVSDETWDALQRERRAAEKAAQELECGLQENAILTVENDNLIAQLSKNLVESKPDHERSHARKETARRIEEGITEERKRLEEEDRLERKHRHEQIRLQLEIARRKKGELEGARKRAEEQRKQEAKAQQKLRQMGICPAGYQWIKQPGGYLCAGGSHWVTDGQLGL